jgi:maltose O-acetyltransferase
VKNVLCNGIASSVLIPRHVRTLIYRALGHRIQTWGILPQCFFGGGPVSIGRNTFVNYGCFFDSLGRITVGDDCALGAQVTLLTSTHRTGSAKRRAGDVMSRPITIGEGCWLGARATVLPGVTVGSGCIIAAGAMVVSDCEPNGLYAGVPAKRIKDLA